MDGGRPTYTQDEVNEILKRALAQEAQAERILSHDELVEIAAEAGIDRDYLDRAMAELAQEQTRQAARVGEAAEIAAERKLQLKRFAASLASYSLLNVFLYVVNARLVGGDWFVWPLVASGVLLTLRVRHVLFPYEKVQRRRKEAQRRLEREKRRAEREAWKDKIFGRRSIAADGAKCFESVVQAGVSILLSVAERKIAEHKSRTSPTEAGKKAP